MQSKNFDLNDIQHKPTDAIEGIELVRRPSLSNY